MDAYLFVILFFNCFILYLVYIYVYVVYRERFLACWCLCGSALIIKLGWDFVLLFFKVDYLALSPFVKLAEQAVVFCAGLCTLKATSLFLGKPLAKLVLYLDLFCFAGIVAVVFSSRSLFLINLPAHVFLSASMAWTGIAFISDKTATGTGAVMTGLFFIIWAALFLLYLFFKEATRFLPWIYFFLSACGTMVVISMLLQFFIKTRKELMESQRHLEYLSQHDVLTGLGNRFFFEKHLHEYSKEKPVSAGIVVCDIDGLKLINDTLGHSCGDSLLKEAGIIIRKSFSADDIMARIGGDEYAIILKNCSREEIIKSCLRLQKHLREYNKKGPGLPLYMSVGFAYSREKDLNMLDLFKDADNMMYTKKLKRSRPVRIAVINALMKTVMEAENITEARVRSVQELAEKIATLIGMPETNVDRLKMLAMYHDIGKAPLLRQSPAKQALPGEQEDAGMKKHCETGCRIAFYSQDLTPIADLILKHHECWDGSGYPSGLKHEQIPLECRILAIAGDYYSLIDGAPDRKSLSHEDARKELIKGNGKKYDPRLLETALRLLENQEKQT
ncbi:MAG: diguanylate cyclase [Peptococcaceae bacterium]|jgi:diguanylate cyclase (GGDEF)-like protein|nr:diguanylate cyclase [Peptococcaceae bacterium]